jgi:methionyl-tRNA formyltransferase
MKRVVFMGTGDIALPSFSLLIEWSKSESFELVGLVTQPDKPVGRKMILTPPSIKVLAEKNGISVVQPIKIKHEIEFMRQWQPDLIVVMAYGQLLPAEIYAGAPLGCVNLHTSLLPKYRGAAPIQAAILNGDSETGVSLMEVVKEMDAGAVIAQKKVVLNGNETGGGLHDDLGIVAAELLKEQLPFLLEGRVKKEEQDHQQVTHVSKLTREKGWILWDEDAASIERRVRAFDSWPSCLALIKMKEGDYEVLKIHRVRISQEGGKLKSGEIDWNLYHQNRLVIGAINGNLEILEAQLRGGKRLPTQEILRGKKLWEEKVVGMEVCRISMEQFLNQTV